MNVHSFDGWWLKTYTLLETGLSGLLAVFGIILVQHFLDYINPFLRWFEHPLFPVVHCVPVHSYFFGNLPLGNTQEP